MLLHVGAFHLDIDSDRVSPWHRLTPQIRIACALLFVFAAALTPNGRWWTWLIYSVGLLILLSVSRITFPVLLRRVAVESTFAGVVLIGTLFRPGETVLFEYGWLQITTEGLIVLGSVCWKALLSLLMLNLLVLTTSIPALLHGMTALKMPPLMVAIIASMYRYIGVLAEEFTSMQRAAASRNLTASKRWQRLVVGNMFGSLFIRTYERGDRVYQAMLSRGYTGLPPIHDSPTPKRTDWFAWVAMICLVLAGQAAYLPR